MSSELYDPTKPFIDEVLKSIRLTHPRKGPITLEPVGKRFRIIMDHDYWKDFDTLDTVDTIGNKARIHWKMRTFSYAIQDGLGMVFNDMMENNFEPYILRDIITLIKEDREAIYSLIKSLTDQCLKYGVIISSGEIVQTSPAFEIGMVATGKRRKNDAFAPQIRENSVVIGIGSNGLHSSGYSFILEKLFDEQHMELDGKFPYGEEIGQELTRPTYIYLPLLKELFQKYHESMHGLVHITGGAFTKLKELKPQVMNLDIRIRREHSLKPQEIFYYLYSRLDIPDAKMYYRFNCGVGYVVAIDSRRVNEVLKLIRQYYPADVIGKTVPGNGRIHIESHFSQELVKF